MVFYGTNIFQWYFTEIAIFRCYKTNFPAKKPTREILLLLPAAQRRIAASRNGRRSHTWHVPLRLSSPRRLFAVGTSTSLGLVRFYGIQSGRNNRYIKKFVIETRIHFGLRFNLLIMIGSTRDRRARLISHLLTSGLIPSLMVCLSWVN
jgi:hypothetical protein